VRKPRRPWLSQARNRRISLKFPVEQGNHRAETSSLMTASSATTFCSALDVNFQIAAFDPKTPRQVGAARKSDTDAIVRNKVLRRFGLAALREISRRTGDDDRQFVGDAHRNHVAFNPLAEAMAASKRSATMSVRVSLTDKSREISGYCARK